MSVVKMLVNYQGEEREAILYSCEKECTKLRVELGLQSVKTAVPGDYIIPFAQEHLERKYTTVEFKTAELYEMNPKPVGNSVSFVNYVDWFTNHNLKKVKKTRSFEEIHAEEEELELEF